ncbi:MAG: ATP-binding protein, partial [Deltaproteobacteria bacterium]|nr:ATP-binding protein [Deltaproteobacteria bacterium]
PGCGKTMLAERVPTILPALTSDEKLELLKILSLHGQISDRFLQEDERPFRAPHHSASYAGLIGGGNGAVRVGEISLAHHGVLFMDELAEFRRDVLEVLRQPLESGRIHLVRSGISLSYPAQFMLIAAMNPCRCGYYGHPKKACNCSMAMIEKYRQKISGPLLDRIDLHLEVMPIDHQMLFTESHAESSERIRERVLVARERQTRRFEAATCNARIAAQDIKQSCQLKESADRLLKQYSVRQVLSPRAIHRILKVSRTIADLDNKDIIEETHIAEALHYRPADQER